MTLIRKAQTTHFFFAQDKLWKMISEIRLDESSPYGKTFDAALVELAAKTFGLPGRMVQADVTKGRYASELDWKDATMHLRVDRRSDTACAFAYEDLATLGNSRR